MAPAASAAAPARLDNCPAPAKLNLFLHVTGRRADGYHLLQTVFQLIDYGDLLHFETRSDGRIRRLSAVAGVPEHSDLIVRAASLLQQHCVAAGRPAPGVDIRIDKRLPMGGGLGGGSSDAATTLMALNQLWQTGLTPPALMALGAQLGADVPFFIFGENAFAEGIGEILQPVATAECWYVVIEPGVAVATPKIFASDELTRDTKVVRITDFSRHDALHCGFGKNDLQEVAVKLFAPINDAIEWLKTYGDARMTGSGACVFCAVSTELAADAVLRNVPACWKAWKARALRRHPMLSIIGAGHAAN